MKFSTDYKNGFKPINITITLENRDELVEFWKRITINCSDIDFFIDKNFGREVSNYVSRVEIFQSLWNELNEILILEGIK